MSTEIFSKHIGQHEKVWKDVCMCECRFHSVGQSTQEQL